MNIHRRNFTLNNPRRGSALVLAVVFTAIMAIVAIFAYKSTMFQTRMASRSDNYLSALAVAEAGAELAMVELNKTSGAWGGWTKNGDTYSLPLSDADTSVADGTNVIGDAEVEVDMTDETNPVITSTGFVPNNTTPKLSRTVRIAAEGGIVPSPFGSFGVFGYEGVTKTGTGLIKSSIGSRESITLTGTSDVIGNLQARSIGITGTGDIEGNVEYVDEWSHGFLNDLDGEAIPGSLPTPPPDIQPPEYSLETLGDITANPTIELGDTVVTVLPGGSINFSGTQDLTLHPGTYDLEDLINTGTGDVNIIGDGIAEDEPDEVLIYVHDLFDITGTGDLNISDEVELTIIARRVVMTGTNDISINGDAPVSFFTENMYITGTGALEIYGDSVVTINTTNVYMTGTGDLNTEGNENPSQLQIFATGAASFTGTQDINGGIYAPAADFNLTGTGDLYGAIIGKTVAVTGTGSVTAYNGLLEPTEGDGVYVTAWAEVSPQSH